MPKEYLIAKYVEIHTRRLSFLPICSLMGDEPTYSPTRLPLTRLYVQRSSLITSHFRQDTASGIEGGYRSKRERWAEGSRRHP